ncbi:MAG: hypothetical protein ACI8TF_002087 [Paracoccaceae bacterium]|jgi:hypothetical protein
MPCPPPANRGRISVRQILRGAAFDSAQSCLDWGAHDQFRDRTSKVMRPWTKPQIKLTEASGFMPCAHGALELCHGPGLTGEQNARHLSTTQFFASCVMPRA